MPKRIALYLRVSTTERTVENQQREPEAVAERRGWNVVAVFTDAGISGTKGREQRPGYDRLRRGVARREFDQVAAWSVDRLGRSLQELVALLGELHAKGVDLYLHQQGIDTGTPAGKAMFQMMGVFAEFERAMIVERVKAGLSRARAHGKRLGRRPVSTDLVERIREHLATGAGILKTAKSARRRHRHCAPDQKGGADARHLTNQGQPNVHVAELNRSRRRIPTFDRGPTVRFWQQS
jgi:DNA invertase Pin-like site-specific DNA recombinase